MMTPVAKAKMLMRCSAASVFDAFVQPEKITSFWLDSTSGPLALGAHVEWQFMVPGAIEGVAVTAFARPQHIAFTWTGSALDVDLRFSELEGGFTVVSVEVRGFAGVDAIEQAIDATEGCSIVLCDLKLLLESGRSPQLVREKAALIARSAGA